MPRFSLTQAFMGTALLAILLSFTQTEGCGERSEFVQSVSFSGDGKKILVTIFNKRFGRVPAKIYFGDIARTISLIDSESGRVTSVVHRIREPGRPRPTANLFHRNRTYAVIDPKSDDVILTTDLDGGIVNRIPADGNLDSVTTYSTTYPYSITISRSGKLLAVDIFEYVSVIDTATGKPAFGLPIGSLRALEFSEAKRLLISSTSRSVQVWDATTGALVSTVYTTKQTSLAGGASTYVPITGACCLNDETVVVCTSKWIRRYDLMGNQIATLLEGENTKHCVASGSLVAYWSRNHVTLYDASSGKNLDVRLPDFVNTLDIAPDGQSIVVGDNRGYVSLIDVATGKQLWKSKPPGIYRYPWTIPALGLAIWIGVVWQLRGRRTRMDVAERQTLDQLPTKGFAD